ncbi:rod shape-determining protein [Streptomyces sp. NPDC091292]|uniref:rod shape-determining protein n=1 Tax=Streptomyces sp. NPDC091292 TaxID=3365991 RepID=UPI003824FE3F
MTPWRVRPSRTGVALDLGSARTRAWMSGRGVVLDVPTVTFADRTATYPVRRGVVVDPEGAALMLERLLSHRLPRFGRPLVVLTLPVPSGAAHRSAALTALEVLRPRTVLTVPTARAVALGACADLTRPLLVVDVGAHLTEVALLTEGAVTDAYRATLGTSDLDATTTYDDLIGAVAGMVTETLRRDRTVRSVEALVRGVLLSGGGALHPDFAPGLAKELNAPVDAVPAPDTAALRGAARVLTSAHRHPSAPRSA